MFLLQSLITREQRPAERNVARRPGIVFTTFDTPPESGGGWSGALNHPRCWNYLPPPSSAPPLAMKFVGKRVFCCWKAIKVVLCAVPSGPLPFPLGRVRLGGPVTSG